jgi:hypothetical protein
MPFNYLEVIWSIRGGLLLILLLLIYAHIKSIPPSYRKKGTEGKLYYKLFQKIKRSKNKKGYDPYIIIPKNLKPTSQESQTQKEARHFWLNVLDSYPLELISSLEKDTISPKDVDYFISRYHSKKAEQNKKESNNEDYIKNQVIERARKWGQHKSGKRNQAIRLGYFLLILRYIEAQNDTQKEWLDKWNSILSLEKPLTDVTLIKNPYQKRSSYTNDEQSLKKNIDEIKDFFQSINFHGGLNKIEQDYYQTNID